MPISGAKIAVSRNDLPSKLCMVSDRARKYSLNGIPPGNVDVTTSAAAPRGELKD